MVSFTQAQKEEWPLFTYEAHERGTLFCAYARKDSTDCRDDARAEIPYGAWVWGWLYADLDTHETVKIKRVGIINAEDYQILYGKHYTDDNWAAQTYKPSFVAASKTTSRFGICAEAAELPPSGNIYLQVEAKYY